MKRTMKSILSLLILSLMLVGMLAFPTAADEIKWDLLKDTAAGYRVDDWHGRWENGEEADGTPYMYHKEGLGGALYIFDDANLISSYKTFSIAGDFYFESFPTGVRTDGNVDYSPEQKPLSLFCWRYKRLDRENSYVFNALRIDSEGYIYTDQNAAAKTNVKLEKGKWINLKCVMTPGNGISELFVNDEKVLDFAITKFDPEKHIADCVRYFDGYFNWEVKMKNLIVSTDNNYSVVLKREDSADFVGYQTAKAEDDTFDARMLFGVNSIDFNAVGYEAYTVSFDEDGNQISTPLRDLTATIYKNIKSGTTVYDAKSELGYEYVAAMVFEDLPSDEGFELVVRPYTVKNGMRRYGVATRLFYEMENDRDGYPIFSSSDFGSMTAPATDDTYIYGAEAASPHGSANPMMVRNVKDENDRLYRAAYFKFTLSPEMVQNLRRASLATLGVYVARSEDRDDRVRYPFEVAGTDIGWTESTLTYNNRQQLAREIEIIGKGSYEDDSYFVIDITSYLKKQVVEADGSMIVSFRVTQENGHGDTLTCYLNSKEYTGGGRAPYIAIYSSSAGGTAELNLGKLDNSGYEPWGYAESIVDEWFDELEPKIYEKDEKGELKTHDTYNFPAEGYNASTPTGDFTEEIAWRDGPAYFSGDTAKQTAVWTPQAYSRTLSTLGSASGKRFVESELYDTVSEYDSYGGITNAGFKGNATGYFHTEYINGRHYIIDPLGNPFFSVGINSLCLGDNQNLQNYSLEKYGTKENYFNEITASLKASGVNLSYAGDSQDVIGVKDGLSCIVSVDTVNTYQSEIGLSGEEATLIHNDTIPVFDPDFITSANRTASDVITENGYATDPRVFGYTNDNELPASTDLLSRYLLLDIEEPVNSFSYATAWSWLARRLDKPNPSYEDYLSSPDRILMESEFLGFVYARIYRVTSEAIKKADPNHMYLGSRVYDVCITDPHYLCAAGEYLDILTINLYGGLNPSAEAIDNFARYSGKPYIISEFFAKAQDALDANGYRLTNPTGAGILVHTQADRATYYEHYTLNLLETGSCVGWIWYRYRDNDQGLYESASGKGPLRMLSVNYTTKTPNSFMDENDNVLRAAEVGSYTTVYQGEKIASNQAMNKGFYNANYTSVVTVYTYKDKETVTSMSYVVEEPESAHPKDGSIMMTPDGKTFVIGTKTTGNVTTKTVLTVYEGKYVALTDSVKEISDHIMGIVNYFDQNR